ncbi:MAG: hypothetical protein ACYC1I_01305 [Acidimicrobiales bacterium]
MFTTTFLAGADFLLGDFDTGDFVLVLLSDFFAETFAVGVFLAGTFVAGFAADGIVLLKLRWTSAR